MTIIKEWKPGLADEQWKVDICDNDIKMVRDIISKLGYIVTCTHNEVDTYNAFAQLTGTQIMDALVSYRVSSKQSVLNAQKR